MRCVIITAIVVILLYGCRKSQSGSSTYKAPNLPPAATGVGTPTGSPVTMTIGPAGGTIFSVDGRVELNFPANALAANTDITIQPVTNTAPNGAGLSYHFMPDGAKFGVPVKLTFHYTTSDANGTDPFLFYIAFQDSTGIWQADFKNRAVDTIGKTASLSISHFSFWSMGSELNLFAFPPQVTEKQTSDVGVVIVNDQGDLTPNGTGEFGLSALPAVTPIPNQAISNWSINGVPGGNAQNGTLSGSGSGEIYTAPATINKERMVQASAAISTDVKGWNKGKQVLQTNKFIVFTDIDLLPKKLSFSVLVTFEIDKTSNIYNDVYTDSARFQVDVDHGTVTASNFSNYAPNVTPPSGTVGLQEAVWTSDGIGLTNITGSLGYLIGGDTIVVALQHTAAVEPYWTVTNIADGSSYSFGGDEVPGYPSAVVFVAKDSAQSGRYNNGGTVSSTWSAIPLH